MQLTKKKLDLKQYMPRRCAIGADREYWMIYRRTGCLAVVWFGSYPTPYYHLSRQRVVSLSQSSWVSLVKLTDGEGGGGRWWRRRKPNHQIIRLWALDRLLLYFIAQCRRYCWYCKPYHTGNKSLVLERPTFIDVNSFISSYTTMNKSMVFHKSFNTLWEQTSVW